MEQEFKNKADYALIFFFEHRKPIKYQFVDNVYKAVVNLDRYEKQPFIHCNVYARRTKRFLVQIKQGDYIDPKPK